MTCDMYEEQVSALVDDELSDEEMGSLFGHLTSCQSCRRSLQSVLNLRSDLAEQVSPMAPKELDERLLRWSSLSGRVSTDRKAVPSHLWTRRISMPVPLAAAILLLFIAGSLMLSPKSMHTETRQLEGRVEAVYITTLPAVDVQGYFP